MKICREANSRTKVDMLVVENTLITVMTTGNLRHIESMAAILGQSLDPDYLLSSHVFMGHLPDRD